MAHLTVVGFVVVVIVVVKPFHVFIDFVPKYGQNKFNTIGQFTMAGHRSNFIFVLMTKYLSNFFVERFYVYIFMSKH